MKWNKTLIFQLAGYNNWCTWFSKAKVALDWAIKNAKKYKWKNRQIDLFMDFTLHTIARQVFTLYWNTLVNLKYSGNPKDYFKDYKFRDKLNKTVFKQLDKMITEFYLKTLEIFDGLDDEGQKNIIGPIYSLFDLEFLAENYIRWIDESLKINIKNYVWYVAYGSNMVYDRFMTYIDGKPFDIDNIHISGGKICSDRKRPIAHFDYKIPYELYFAGWSKRWNSPVAFLNWKNNKSTTYCVYYLISRKQFEHVKKQEGSKYDMVLCLGKYLGIDAKTFTSSKILKYEKQISDSYRQMLKWGLLGSRDLPEKDINAYIDKHLKK